MNMMSTASSRPLMALTLCLVLAANQLVEIHGFNVFGIKLGTTSKFVGSPPSLPPAPGPGPGPGPGSAPGPGPGQSDGINPARNGPPVSAAAARRGSGTNADFDTSPGDFAGLQVGFYLDKCSSSVDVEAIIAFQTQQEFARDPTILPALLRMQFHDCFVQGCDASILVDGVSTEKTAGPNLSVRGFEFIELVKLTLEEQCPGVVSCADIIAVATKEVLVLGLGLDYPVQTGRRDGLVSLATNVNLPSPDMSSPQAVQAFGDKGFTAEEMVVLLGAHSVGITHCSFFSGRITPGSSQFDFNMDPTLRFQLTNACSQGGPSVQVKLNQDPLNINEVDNSFYNQLLDGRGILAVDQDLSRDPGTSLFVFDLAGSNTVFNIKFANALIKLQALDVLVGAQGSIRTTCSSIS